VYRNDKIRGKQAELGMSVEELADKAGVNPNTVSAIRGGKTVRTDSLEKVVKALGMTMLDVHEPKAEELEFATG
jgi:transcriptional regulator with XRE-family HTH domain